MKSFDQGKFVPRNPNKYKGDVRKITYRSSWEKKLLLYLDKNSDVIEYSSEEVVIPYVSPIDNKIHRYFVDFLIKVKTKNSGIQTYLVEVKPKKQTIKPKPKKTITERYVYECKTYAINKAKWDAAEKFCRQKNWKFIIFTEDHLGIK